MPNPDGSQDTIVMALLRPLSWINVNRVVVGEPFDLQLGDLGISGTARVTAIRAAPLIRPGYGRVVLATFTHLNAFVTELRLAGAAELLQVTGPHKLYSEDRRGWVRVDDLNVGERLRSANGPLAIESITDLSGIHRVYNLEVESEHMFLVGPQAVWAHNADCPGIRAQMRNAGREGLPGGSRGKVGKYRFRPEKGAKQLTTVPTRAGKAYVDRFGNVWKQGPYHGDPSKGFTMEWDVQLSPQGKTMWGGAAKGKDYINVAPDGTISH
jgi:hypothetical protein